MRLRPARIALLLLSVSLMPTFARADTIIDSLGDFTTADILPLPGASGVAVGGPFQIGPFFVLEGRTRITEIGAFMTACASRLPDCEPDTFFVDIYPSSFGLPDTNRLLRTFALPLDPDPLTFTYLSVDPQLSLPAGAYFAMFRAELVTDEIDNILLSRYDPGGIHLLADLTILGLFSESEPDVIEYRAATRILGEPEIPESGSLILALSGLTLALLARRNRH